MARASSSAQVAAAMVQHAQLMERMRRFQERYPFMLRVQRHAGAAALRCIAALADADRGCGDAALHRLDALGVLDFSRLGAGQFQCRPDSWANCRLDCKSRGAFANDLGVLQLAHAFEQATARRRAPPGRNKSRGTFSLLSPEPQLTWSGIWLTTKMTLTRRNALK